MTEVRRQMEDDMVARGFATGTRESYLWAVTGLAQFYRRPPIRLPTRRCKRLWSICFENGACRRVRATSW
jgi:hypothetical protein